jgi:hypothetical protein
MLWRREKSLGIITIVTKLGRCKTSLGFPTHCSVKGEVSIKSKAGS